MPNRIISALVYSFSLAFLLVCLPGTRARADVGVILNETLDESVARVTGSGHTAVYFSRICPDSPVKLRLCRPGENGSVMSNYINLGEDTSYEWNIAPFNLYVYGLEDTRYRAVFATPQIKNLLEEKYRDQALAAYCTGPSCLKSNKAEWREMVGASMARSMYIFIVETSVQQDLDLIAKFNALPNENHFNGFTRNCADFTKGVIDTYFPHSAHRDFINDFGMTSPKAVARTFSQYAEDHPETHFRVMHFSQLPGTIKRSTEPHSGTEQLYHSKKLLVPMVIFAQHELPVAAAAYLITGRFNPQHEFEEHPAVEAVPVNNPVGKRKTDDADLSPNQLEAIEIQKREELLGAPGEWKKYRKAFDSLVSDAVRDEIIPDRNYVTHTFKRMDESGKATIDADGNLWMRVTDSAGPAKVGVSINNLFAPESDPRLAFVVLLARVDAVLKSPTHSRETMLEFKEDWALLQYARLRISGAKASAEASRLRGTIAPAGGGN
jgi:hypothetical protein